MKKRRHNNCWFQHYLVLETQVAHLHAWNVDTCVRSFVISANNALRYQHNMDLNAAIHATVYLTDETYLAYAFSNSPGQKLSDCCDCRKPSLPWTVGNLSSTRTSVHSPHHHSLNLNTPAYWSPLNDWSAGTTR